ncbi:hypothetical protein LINPERHAP2_LOCUS15364, partial [Linum perenne]
MHENSRSSSNFLGERRSHGSRMLIERGRRRLVQKSRRTTIGLGVPRSVEAAAGADDGGEGSPAITSSSEKKKGGMHHYEELRLANLHDQWNQDDETDDVLHKSEVLHQFRGESFTVYNYLQLKGLSVKFR